MDREQALEQHGELIAGDTCVEAYLCDGDLYWRHEGLNEVEMAMEIIYYRMLDGAVEPEIVPLGRYFQAKRGEQLK